MSKQEATAAAIGGVTASRSFEDALLASAASHEEEAPIRSTHNTWEDPRILNHSEVGAVHKAQWDEVRAAAEHLHRNESLHRHDPSGEVCIYCALNASRVLRYVDRLRRGV